MRVDLEPHPAGDLESGVATRPASTAQQQQQQHCSSSSNAFRQLEAGEGMPHTRRSIARRPFSRADQRSTNISHMHHCSMWIGTPRCAPHLHCKQQVEFALTTSSRSRAVAAVEAAHARSRPASPQTRGWHRERARPTTSRSREIYDVFGRGECSYVSEAVFAFRQETELCARSHDNSLPAAFLICPGSVIVCFQGPLPLRGLIAALTYCLARAARGAAGDLVVRIISPLRPQSRC